MKAEKMFNVVKLDGEVYLLDKNASMDDPNQWVYDHVSPRVIRSYQLLHTDIKPLFSVVTASSKALDGVSLISKSLKKFMIEGNIKEWKLKVEYKLLEEQYDLELPQKPAYVCKKCGSKSVFGKAYANLNTCEFDSWYDKHDPMAWCEKCQEMVEYELKTKI